jgi:hypothetical protein
MVRIPAAVPTAGVSKGPAAAIIRVEDSSPWQLAVPRRVVMPHPHMEAGSQDLISISASEVQNMNLFKQGTLFFL